MYDDYRPRLSINLPPEEFERLNRLFGELRIKNKVYYRLTIQLIELTEKLPPEHRHSFLLALAEGNLNALEYLPLTKTIIHKINK